MKLIAAILIVVGLGVCAGVVITLRKPANLPNPAVVLGNSPTQAASEASPVSPRAAEPVRSSGSAAVASTTAVSANSSPANTAMDARAAMLLQSLDTLTSRQASFEQKQSIWGKLRDSGRLDEAIAELDRRVAANPSSPENLATLGQACLHKAGSIQDIRQQGILGMKADQNFEAALEADSNNWEARFWRATAMSYWPVQLGKGKEVVENCLELIKQQEVLPPKPEYAQTYVLLGEQYEKLGHSDYALEIWKRGAGLFPNHDVLTQKSRGSSQAKAE